MCSAPDTSGHFARDQPIDAGHGGGSIASTRGEHKAGSSMGITHTAGIMGKTLARYSGADLSRASWTLTGQSVKGD